MSKVIFLNTATYDHVYSTLGLAKALVERGEEVVYFTAEDFKEAVEHLGAEFRCSNYFTMEPSAPPFLVQSSLIDVLYSSLLFNTRTIKKTIDFIFDEVQKLKPDYIIYGHRAFWGKEIARKLNVPAVCVFSGIVVNKKVFYENPVEFVHLYFGNLYQLSPEEIAKIISFLNRVFKKKAGIADISEGLITEADLNIVYTHEFLQGFRNLLDDTYIFAGYSHYQKYLQDKFPDDIPNDLLSREDGLIYVTVTPSDRYHLKWNPTFYPVFFAGLKNEESRVVLNYHYENEDYYKLVDIPRDIYAKRFEHHGKLIGLSQMVITTGSYSSVYESLFHGVPMIIIPVGGDQFMIAKKIEELNLGIYLRPAAFTAESLQSAIKKIRCDHKYKENCLRYKELLMDESSDRKAADMIISHMMSRLKQ